jgi:hypothetical protein
MQRLPSRTIQEGTKMKLYKLRVERGECKSICCDGRFHIYYFNGELHIAKCPYSNRTETVTVLKPLKVRRG